MIDFQKHHGISYLVLSAPAVFFATACQSTVEPGGTDFGDGTVSEDQGSSDGDASNGDTDALDVVLDPETAEQAFVDRFSDQAATRLIRSQNGELPAPNEPVDFDRPPFLIEGFGPGGELVTYYDFDDRPLTPAPVFKLVDEDTGEAIEGQRSIFSSIPGDDTYSDFWQVCNVTVPSDYVANTITSYEEIVARGLLVEKTTKIVNCPIAPAGSTATLRLDGGDNSLIPGWYKDQVVGYFVFEERELFVESATEPVTPLSEVFVTFQINPGEEGGGMASGLKTESGTSQTHNVLATLPDDDDYSPLWIIRIYDNAAFDDVVDLSSAESAPRLIGNAGYANCPVAAIAAAE